MKFLYALFIAFLIASPAFGETSDPYEIYHRQQRSEVSPNLPEVNSYINKLHTSFSPNTVKAMFWLESRWTMEDGPDIGIGQINEPMVRKFYPRMNVQRLKTDWRYNLRMSAGILEDKLEWVKWRKRKPGWEGFCKRYCVEGLTDGELAVLAYNGMRADHSYLKLVKKYKDERPWNAVPDNLNNNNKINK